MKLRLALIISLASPALMGCYGLYGHDELDRYAQRADTITLSAGDAKEVNARAHTPTPWPRDVADRRIPARAERIERGMDRYYGRPKQQQGAPGTGVNGVMVNPNAPTGPAAGTSAQTGQ